MLQFMQRTFVLLFIALGFPLTAVAGVTIKMATLAPEGSIWYKGL
jgi:hypothetical protein